MVIIKRRRKKKLERRDLVRSTALRMDMERDGSPTMTQLPPASHIDRSSDSSTNRSDEDGLPNPPPPYPTHAPRAHFKDSHLPIYQEDPEEYEHHDDDGDDNDDDNVYYQDNGPFVEPSFRHN